MNLHIAESSEILLAMRRDDEHVESLVNQLSALFKTLFGQQLWIRYYQYFPYLCRFLYYSSTNLFNRQTLGEEYVQLIQVSDQHRRTPVHVIQRLCFLLFETCGDVLINMLIKSASELLGIKYRNDPDRAVWIKLLFSFIELNGLNTLHKAIFFAFCSKYYSLSRRMAGISYLSLRVQTNSMITKFMIFIGISTIVQCIAVFLLKTAKERRIEQMTRRLATNFKSVGKGKEDAGTTHVCAVCSVKRLPVCTPCGHIFCWSCVVEYSVAESKSTGGLGKCPNCRENFPLNRVVPLMNF